MSPVVLCGSLGSTAAMWDAQQPVLAGKDVIRFELPGHGAAPVTRLDGIDTLAEQAITSAGGRFTLVGLSLGGAVAMRVAAKHSARVERLVLACTSPRFGEPSHWHERAATVRRNGLGTIVDAVLARWFTPAFDDAERYRAMFLSVHPEGYARCCDVIAGWDGRADLARIEAPTLVVAGAGDPTSPPAHAQEIADLIPNARTVVIDDAAHLANVERPDVFNELLREVL